jgi:phage shock protein E
MQRALLLSIALAMLCTLPTTKVLAADEHTKDSLDTIKKNLADKKAVILDVREKREWDAGHLKQAQLVPLSDLTKDKKAAVKGIDKKQIVYLHCRSGRRSLQAAEILKSMGFDARALKPGYAELLKAGFPKAD